MFIEMVNSWGIDHFLIMTNGHFIADYSSNQGDHTPVKLTQLVIARVQN